MGRAPIPRGSPQYINKLNKIKILNLIRERGKLSRADAAKSSGISAPTVTRIVDSLIHDKLVHEIGAGISSGGRRPTLLEFSGLNNFVIGIDLGTTHIDAMLSNLNAEAIAEVKCPTVIDEGFEGVMERVGKVICELRNHPRVRGKKIFGVGLAVAGLVNRWNRIIEYSPDFHWKEADVLTSLHKYTDFHIIFDNVTRVMALGELWYGIGQKVKNYCVINIGYGIGAGIIINGRPLYGPKGMAGEFGHITLEKDSDLQCECGNYGCLEALASGRAIALAARKELEKGVDSHLMEMCAGNISTLTTEMVVQAAKNGDAIARQVFDRAAEYLGIGISALVNLFSPEAILIGGGVSQAGDLLLKKVKGVVLSRTLKVPSRKISIEPATYGVKAAVMGSIALILNEILHLNFTSGIPALESEEQFTET